VAQTEGIRGPVVSRTAGPTHLVSVLLRLSLQEQAAVEDPAFAPEGSLTAAFTTIDFFPHLVRYKNGEMIIDYSYNGNTSASCAAWQSSPG